ncbi:hypothetical protein PIIN_07041 [Serendipita indica DSM 11827]|uniref:Uncharacterized protein n=1 Tax=Serendipita indica (strain DSM 11827) TaxID=1109443 RepID=G4TP44_SERID|nr:hypothetical protein PIIN_07041 [Serendipita indica DSM 11827]
MATPSKIELPPPAWGSPAHMAQRKAEKEWKIALRAYATKDVENRKTGKCTHYTDNNDIVIRYHLPPAWDVLNEPGAAVKIVREGDAVWDLPEDDDELVKVLKATYAPFYQRTGEFSKPSTAFKTPPISKKASPSTSPTPTPAKPLPEATFIVTESIENYSTIAKSQYPVKSTTMASLPNVTPSGESTSQNENSAVQPRRTYLPVALSNLFGIIGRMFLWFIPSPLRVRLHAWWSPVLRDGGSRANRV